MVSTRQTKCPREEVERAGGRKRARRVGAGLALPNPSPPPLSPGSRGLDRGLDAQSKALRIETPSFALRNPFPIFRIPNASPTQGR